MRWIVSYDMADNKRRTRVVKLLSARGRRVERSVFECRMSGEEAEKLWEQLQMMVDVKEDCCHLVPVDERGGRFCRIGREMEEGWAAMVLVR